MTKTSVPAPLIPHGQKKGNKKVKRARRRAVIIVWKKEKRRDKMKEKKKGKKEMEAIVLPGIWIFQLKILTMR